MREGKEDGEAVQAPADAEKKIVARIDDLSKMGRTIWLSLIGFLAFAVVSLLGVHDSDFFVLTRETTLPLANVTVPTAAVFIMVPVLAATMFIYLHIHLLKLLSAIAAAPPNIAGRPLSEHVHPWIVNDVALSFRTDGALEDRPLAGVIRLVTIGIIWWATPVVLTGFWWGSMVAHNEVLTLCIALCLFAVLFMGRTTRWTATEVLSGSANPPQLIWRRKARIPVAGVVVLAVLSIGWVRSGGGVDVDNGFGIDRTPVRTSAYDIDGNPAKEFIDRAPAWWVQAKIDLAGADLVTLPATWRTPETARKIYRETWCRREALPMIVCDHLPEFGRATPAYLGKVRAEWCAQQGIGGGATCSKIFTEYDARFQRDWAEERISARSALPKVNLSSMDLRRARAFGVSLVGAKLFKVRLSGADLSRSNLEGADLREAVLEAVDLSGGRLEDSVLWGANLSEADLSRARMTDADLAAASLDLSDLSFAVLERADLSNVKFSLVSLQRTRMRGGNLTDAQVVASVFYHSDLREVQWQGARLQSVFHGSDLRGAVGLTQAQLDASIGDENTLLPDGLAPDTGQPYSIPTCWTKPPASVETFVERFVSQDFSAARIRDAVLCDSGVGPERTGRILALSARYPEGHPLKVWPNRLR